jgi:hypothetical protein
MQRIALYDLVRYQLSPTIDGNNKITEPSKHGKKLNDMNRHKNTSNKIINCGKMKQINLAHKKDIIANNSSTTQINWKTACIAMCNTK